MNSAAPSHSTDYTLDLRRLVFMDTQFGLSGETTLTLPEIERLVARGWVAEGDENAEFDITDAGRAVIDSVLSAQPTVPAPAGMVLVPREPTREMCLAARREVVDYPVRADADSPVVVYRAMLAAAQAADEEAECAALHATFPDLHHATRCLVWNFAVALGSKLAEAEKKYGYSDGWRDADWMDECRVKLLEHVAKGDPRDVAAYCAFLWHHGERTVAPAAQAPVSGCKSDVCSLYKPTGVCCPNDSCDIETGTRKAAAPVAVPTLINPHTGEPRDYRDVNSDPEGILCVPPGPLKAAAPSQCAWPDCGHDTNCVGYSPGCTGKFCPAAAPAVVANEEWTPTDRDISDWLERHDLEHAIRGGDARAAFEDARSAHMLAALKQGE